MIETSNKTLSLLIPLFNSEKKIQHAYEQVKNCLETEQIPYEILLIDDGSTDQTWSTVQQIAAHDPKVRIYRLSRNYTSPYVQFAGFSVCKGACITFMPDDLQNPLTEIVRSYRLWEAGEKLILTYRISRNDGWWTDFFAKNYYRIINLLSDIKIPPGGIGNYLADREIIDIMNTQIHPIHTSSIMEVLRLGFSPVYLPTSRPKTIGKSRWTWKKKVRLAKDTFFASSTFPIRAITNLGLFISLLCLLALPFLFYARFFAHSHLFGFPVSGWVTLVTILVFFNGLVLFSLGVVAEYIWRIYEEVKGRPGFIIRKD
jgi:polyisoprenyl-phosphate glycosyltransferase